MSVVCLGVFLVILNSLCSSLVAAEELFSSFTIRKSAAILTNAAVIKRIGTDDLMSCARICGREPLCKFAHFDEKRNTCVLVRETTVKNTGIHCSEKENSIVLEKVDYNRLKGTLKPLAVPNCKELLKINPASTSGVYWIDPDGGSHDNASKAYCDQVTDGGGWTLVWSYRFTDYANFNSRGNAITPRPNWEVTMDSNVRISRTPPLSETQYDAVEFSRWKEIGSDVLIKSNINNWITCKPGTGSLVDWVEGTVTCHLVKIVNRKCSGIWPSKFGFKHHGPTFSATKMYYYFDGYKGTHWPTHDPCGENKPNQLTGIDRPHGNIFIR